MRIFSATFVLLFIVAVTAHAQSQPIVDVHVHAWNVVQDGPDAPENRAHLERFLATTDSLNVVLFIASGPQAFTNAWKEAAGDRMMAGPMFPCYGGVTPNEGQRPCFESGSVFPNIDWLREQYEHGTYEVMGELINPYAGMAYDNKQMGPYYALAESLDVPVAVHLRGAPPMTAQHCCPEFRLEFGDPLTLGKILARHPELRLHVMHADVTAMPELLLLLRQYPNVYVDLTPYHMVLPREGFHKILRTYKRNGMIDRVMFGTDGTPYESAIEAYESASFLTEEDLNNVFCGNAARFLNRPSLCE